MQLIINKVLETIKKYDLINEGDRIAVGLSGGKDSLTLLLALNSIQKFYSKHFDLIAIAVDMFNGQTNYNGIIQLCSDLQIPLYIEKSQIYEILFEVRKEKNPCSLCSKLRKGILNNKAKELGCNKVALGHHADDFVETFFLSMTFEGRLSTFSPVSYLDRIKLTQIRPLLLVREKNIINNAKSMNLPIVKNECPADKHTKREDVKKILDDLEKLNPKIRYNIIQSLVNFDRQQGFFNIRKNNNS